MLQHAVTNYTESFYGVSAIVLIVVPGTVFGKPCWYPGEPPTVLLDCLTCFFFCFSLKGALLYNILLS